MFLHGSKLKCLLFLKNFISILSYLCLMVFPSCDNEPVKPQSSQIGGPLPDSSYIYRVQFLDTSTGWVINQNTITERVQPGIYKTTNGGKSWINQYQTAGAMLNGLAVVNKDFSWVIGDSGIIVATFNGGNTWYRQESNTNYSLREIQMIDQNEGWIIGFDFRSVSCNSGNNIILHTTDGGMTWLINRQGTEAAFRSIHFNRRAGWVVGSGLLDNFCGGVALFTSDKGVTWSRRTPPNSRGLDYVRVINDTVSLVAGDGQLFRTSDRGLTWTQLSSDAWSNGITFLSLPTETKIYILSFGDQIQQRAISYSSDQGLTWQREWQSEPRQYLLSVWFLDDYYGWSVGVPTLFLKYFHGVWSYEEN